MNSTDRINNKITVRALAEAFNIGEDIFKGRINRGWDIYSALTKPVKGKTEEREASYYAKKIIAKITGERITNSGALSAIEQGLVNYGNIKYKNGLMDAASAIRELNNSKTTETLKKIMDMI